MKKILLVILSLLYLAAGVLIEHHFDLFPHRSDSKEEADHTGHIPRWNAEFTIVQIRSPIDGAMQKAYFYRTKSLEPKPLIVSLHSWSHDYTQYDSINQLSLENDYNYIHPDFRGTNDHKDACCGNLVISDIDASIDFALDNANVDTSRIFVIGMSGGGYAALAMFMKSKHNVRKFSSWVPLVDLVKWYDETRIRKLKYAEEILSCTESTEGTLNIEVAKRKSPYYWVTPAQKLKSSRLEMYAGIYDGMIGNGVIPITHSINFYNKLLADVGEVDSRKYVSDSEKLKLLEYRKPLSDYPSIAGRRVALAKESNNIRLTLFEGGHEMLNEFAFRELVK